MRPAALLLTHPTLRRWDAHGVERIRLQIRLVAVVVAIAAAIRARRVRAHSLLVSISKAVSAGIDARRIRERVLGDHGSGVPGLSLDVLRSLLTFPVWPVIWTYLGQICIKRSSGADRLNCSGGPGAPD